MALLVFFLLTTSRFSKRSTFPERISKYGEAEDSAHDRLRLAACVAAFYFIRLIHVDETHWTEPVPSTSLSLVELVVELGLCFPINIEAKI